jgi:hypothetical protein
MALIRKGARSIRGMAFMAVFLTVGALAGIILGLRCNVFVLIPAITVAITAIALGDIATHQNIKVMVVTTLATGVLLQIGYLGGRFLKVVAENYVDTMGMRHRSSGSQLT